MKTWLKFILKIYIYIYIYYQKISFSVSILHFYWSASQESKNDINVLRSHWRSKKCWYYVKCYNYLTWSTVINGFNKSCDVLHGIRIFLVSLSSLGEIIRSSLWTSDMFHYFTKKFPLVRIFFSNSTILNRWEFFSGMVNHVTCSPRKSHNFFISWDH